MDISPLQNSDIEFTDELQPPDWRDIKPHLMNYVNSSYCDPLKITIENKIVAIGTTVKHADTVWLALIIVHPEYRNRGLGKIMTDTLIESVDNSKFKTIYLIATQLGHPVYKKCGFEIETEYVLLENENHNFSESLSEFIFPFEDKFRKEILKLDKIISGENRKVRLNEAIQSSYVFLSGGNVSGAYLPDLGDGLIIASDPGAGIELMKLRLQKSDHVIIPEGNKVAVEFLKQNNFRTTPKVRMILGKKRKWHPENIYNWVSGQIG